LEPLGRAEHLHSWEVLRKNYVCQCHSRYGPGTPFMEILGNESGDMRLQSPSANRFLLLPPLKLAPISILTKPQVRKEQQGPCSSLKALTLSLHQGAQQGDGVIEGRERGQGRHCYTDKQGTSVSPGCFSHCHRKSFFKNLEQKHLLEPL
jgi:hypothetical protein